MTSGTRPPHTLTVPEGYRVGPWTVGATVGSGAFGTVCAATRETGGDDGTPSRAALKFLPTGTRTPRQLRHLRDLAERETALLRRVREPRLIRMYDVLTVDDPDHPDLDGATVLVLERAERSLEDLLAERPEAAREAGPALLAQVCEGLVQLHRAGWVHGDLKPANVLLMADGTARLADFSTAAELEGTHAYAPPFATPDHSPPELLRPTHGERGTRTRPTADIWAFGVLAHLVLAGTHPLPGATVAARKEAAVRYARRAEDLRLSPRLPAAWRPVVADCLARTHAERAAHDAESLLPRVVEAAREAALPHCAAPRRRFLSVAPAAAVLGALALGLLAWPDDRGPVEAGAAEPAGYARCLQGDVCFFTEPDGRGRMCAWTHDDTNWQDGAQSCSWAAADSAGSVFNNGFGTAAGETYVDVVYFSEPSLRARLGCVENGTRANLPAGTKPRSHTWAKAC
ncbi:protein kinase domain-containing protein [Streptomyces sp. NPDC001658]